MRILIADDDDVARLEVEALLTRHGHEVIAVSDGTYAYLTTNGHHATGNLVDAGWVTGYLLLALAAFSPATRAENAREHAHDWRGWLPYPAVLLCGLFIAIAAQA